MTLATEPLCRLSDLIAPGSRPRAQPLAGSADSRIELVELYRHARVVDRIVVKWFGGHGAPADPRMCRRQARLLEHLDGRGVLAPCVRFADPEGLSTGLSCIAMSYLPGSARLPRRDVAPRLRDMGAALAGLHAVPPGHAEPDEALPQYGQAVGPHMGSPLAAVQAGTSLPSCGVPAALVPAALEGWRRHRSDLTVIMHGDYHPGNVLWHDDQLSGIVDWDYASFGPAGFDVAHCRTDLVLLSGRAAADEFLAGYEERAGAVPDLAAWDLHRSLAAYGNFEQWIPNMSPVGFPINTVAMRHRLSCFIADSAKRIAAM